MGAGVERDVSRIALLAEGELHDPVPAGRPGRRTVGRSLGHVGGAGRKVRDARGRYEQHEARASAEAERCSHRQAFEAKSHPRFPGQDTRNPFAWLYSAQEPRGRRSRSCLLE